METNIGRLNNWDDKNMDGAEKVAIKDRGSTFVVNYYYIGNKPTSM